MGQMVFFAGAILLVAAVLWSVWSYRTAEARRSAALKEIAEVLRLRYAPSDPGLLSEFSSFNLFRLGESPGTVTNVLWRDSDGERVILFDYTLDKKPGNAPCRRQTVVACRSPELRIPQFCLFPHRTYQQCAHKLTLQRVDWQEYPQLEYHFYWGGDLERLRTWISRRLVNVILTDPQFVIEGCDDKLLIYPVGKRIPASETRDFFRLACDILSHAKECSSMQDGPDAA